MVDEHKNAQQQPAASFDPYDQRKHKKTRGEVGCDGIEPGTKFEILAFDIGQVSVPFNWPEVEAGFAQHIGCSREEVSAAMKKLSLLGYESGDIDTPSFIEALNEYLDCRISPSEFSSLWNNTFVECETMKGILEKLNGTHRMFALSNTNPEHYEYLDKVLNVYRHYEELILSHQVGYMKPHKRIYQEVLKRARKRVRKNQVLFVDDKPEFIHGARKYGFYAILFTTPEALIQRFREIGLA